MMDFFTNNLAQSFFVLGLILLIIEVAVLGFSTFVLFFVGLAAIVTGVLLYVNILSDSVLTAMLCMGIFSLIAAVILWRPLKKMQSNVSPKKAQGDLVGHCFILQDTVSPVQPTNYHYSGVNWKLMSLTLIEAGTKVEVTDIEVGVFHVRKVEERS